jgi:O-antigen/teichoic acid export membrane protein
VLSNVVGPQIARLHAAGDTERLRTLVSYVALAMTAGSFATALPVIFFGNYALATLFGPEFVGAQMPLVVLCLGYAISACLGPSLAFMNLTGRERTVTRSFGASFASSLIFGAAAISLLDATGAAVGNVIGYFVWNMWLWRQAKRQANVDTSLVPAAREMISRIGRRG